MGSLGRDWNGKLREGWEGEGWEGKLREGR
jgi:hypothetical protein